MKARVLSPIGRCRARSAKGKQVAARVAAWIGTTRAFIYYGVGWRCR